MMMRMDSWGPMHGSYETHVIVHIGQHNGQSFVAEHLHEHRVVRFVQLTTAKLGLFNLLCQLSHNALIRLIRTSRASKVSQYLSC